MICILSTALVLLWAIGMMTGNLLSGAVHQLIVGALVMMLFTSVSLQKIKVTQIGRSMVRDRK